MPIDLLLPGAILGFIIFTVGVKIGQRGKSLDKVSRGAMIEELVQRDVTFTAGNIARLDVYEIIERTTQEVIREASVRPTSSPPPPVPIQR
jgi:hypothetical protein